jgi:hypothetical protein
MNQVIFKGMVTKVFKSGIVVEIPPRNEKGVPVSVWVRHAEGLAQPSEKADVIISGCLSVSKGKNGGPPQLIVYAFNIYELGAASNDTVEEDESVPF